MNGMAAPPIAADPMSPAAINGKRRLLWRTLNSNPVCAQNATFMSIYGTSRHIISPIDHHLDPRKVSEKWNRPIVRALNVTAALNSANTEKRVDKYEYVNPKIVTSAAEAI